MGIENMDFGRAHHSGMPTEAELKWRRDIVKAELEGRYGEENVVMFEVQAADYHGVSEPEVVVINPTPVAEIAITKPGAPNMGTINNFRTPRSMSDRAYSRMVAKAEYDWNHRMD